MEKEMVAELEGTLLTERDLFPYLMLVAFEASGVIRFTLLLLLWPVIHLLRAMGREKLALRIMVFVAVAGVRERELQGVGRAVLPKFFFNEINLAAWKFFNSGERRVIITELPRFMVEKFAVDHLHAHEVLGTELHLFFGVATGFLLENEKKKTMGGQRRVSAPFPPQENSPEKPSPVIFHDGRLVPKPTPGTALLIILWIPFGVIVAFLRILAGVVVPLRLTPYLVRPFGGELVVHGRPPQSTAGGSGVLFVCTHRTLMDPIALSMVLRRRIPAVTYSLSRLSEILSPIKTVRLSRNRDVDAEKIRAELARGDLVVCPEGTTCREPFLLRFSGLFAELTDRIVPVAMNYRVGFFHATSARGWKAMDPIFFMMNPRPAYEVTFLNQLPAEATCAAGKSPIDVANNVQKILGSALGFECTNFTRRDKYRALAGNDGTVTPGPISDWFKELLAFFVR